MLLGGHDCGLGKTASALQAYAAQALMLNRRPKMVISAPSSTLDQWYDSVADWIRVDPKHVMVTSRLRDITKEALKDVDILILTRDCLSRAFSESFQKYEQHSQVQTGVGLRWISRWDRKGGVSTPNGVVWPPENSVELNALFNPTWAPPKSTTGRGSAPPNTPGGAPPRPNPNPDLGDSPSHPDLGGAQVSPSHPDLGDSPSPVWDMLVIDEAHFMRNPESKWCESHSKLSQMSRKRLLLSGTFVVNKPLDLAGLAKAGDAPRGLIDFQDKRSWTLDKSHKTINRKTVLAFRELHIDRATDAVLDPPLPLIEREAVNYDVNVSPDDAEVYNSIRCDAKTMKLQLERAGSGPSAKDMQRLMSVLTLMQQFAICPLLAQIGAAKMKSDETLMLEATKPHNVTGSFYALRDELNDLQRKGHRKIVVAANHVVILKILRLWIDSTCPQFGKTYLYCGEIEAKARLAVKKGFLTVGERSLLLLSIGAGGTGIHLVPGCEAMVFWGSMPFSPAQVNQCLKRIHRMGQTCPQTGKVTVRHLIPYGSVDYGIATAHGDKLRLIDFVQDGDSSGFGDNSDNQWRKCMRIVDECKKMLPCGNFEPMPRYFQDINGNVKEPRKVFTLLPGVSTRGRETQEPPQPHPPHPPHPPPPTSAVGRSKAALDRIGLGLCPSQGDLG